MANIFDLFRQIENEKKEPESSRPITYLVVGLGNPGKEYVSTRHNAGFLALDFVAEKCGARIDRAKYKALVGEARIGEERILLMKPQTYMNLSGEAVGEAARFYKLDASHVIVLSDDTTLEPGRLRVRRKGSAGGHNGLKSITEHLSTDAYPRIKIGVGQKPSPDYDLVKWVLGRFSSDEMARLEGQFENIGKAVELMLVGKIDEAMNKFSK